MSTWIYLVVLLFVLFEKTIGDIAGNQLPHWKEKHGTAEKATDQRGVIVPSMTASLTLGREGPMLLQDTNFLELMAHFDRERIPERVVHARGNGAFGEFVVTHDITKYTKAKIFEKIGKKTPVLVRFSTVTLEMGSSDLANDPRGFAVKYYTDDGNWDLTGNNIPNFPIRDPILFPSFVHSRKRNPETNLPDANTFWDFVSLRQESVLHTMFQFAGIPDGVRKMDGFGVHAFKLVNKNNEPVYVKFHLTSEQGVKYLDWNEAKKMDPNYSTRDLYNSIAEGKFPSWILSIQVMSFDDAMKSKMHPFDITKVWKESEYPLIPVGRMVLNRNPTDIFEEMESAAFHPGNLVPGIEHGPDRMLHGRMFSYSDSQRYRLGANFLEIPVNKPDSMVKVRTYVRGGHHASTAQGGAPNYHPNSFNGPEVDPRGNQTIYHEPGGDVLRYDTGEEDNYSLATWRWKDVLKADERQTLVNNIAGHLKQAEETIRKRALAMYGKVSPDFQTMLEAAIK